MLLVTALVTTIWGQKDYLPNLYSRRNVEGHSMLFVYERELSQGELTLTYLAKIT